MHDKQTQAHPNSRSTDHRASLGASRLIGRIVLFAVLALAFVGYLTPDMRIQWANLMTLCGF